ncbi:ABC transporter ATP-binding protein [Phycicoccus endophyticus]|uniref:ABC transporter ATP-binding protein n=1 Tax=Phycicoccus endophyticus TaxID=1690220 RepID=A0A7G9R288_9MICO|nr:ABC transporter ATP-binding protein [Phycicoccus endophyticus]NHI19627.1 ABC transporter ATP-binding protein [Phycicoccus endophyticus]QNN49713.1 ABC transporter ATP-binding protein [Phycicoccus endophyticus]GGL34410.1 ABC transporter [Phycicoccus endophyticus]
MTIAPPDTTTATAVRLVDVHKTYPGGAQPVAALRGVSLSLDTGSLTAVVGQSGSGKSTLLNVAAGLDLPTSGRVVVGGRDTTGLSPDQLTRFRREHVGFVFQAYNLIPHLSVVDNIRLPLVLAGRAADEVWIGELLDALGLAGLEQRRPGELSGGQSQRVAIARALVARPAVVFADEPTGALDSHTGASVLELLRVAAHRFGQTVVVVTHDAHVAAAAQRVLFLADGLVVHDEEDMTPERVTARLLETGR